VRRLARKLLRPHVEYFGFAMRIVYTGLALLVSVLLARLLGPAPLGRYYEVVAWIILIGTVVRSGWAPMLVREVAALRELQRYAELRGLIRTVLRIVAAISLAAAALFLAVSWFVAGRETFELFLVGSPIAVLLATSSLRQAVTRGMGRPLLGLICENLTRPGIQLIGLAALASGLVAVYPTPLATLVTFLIAIAASAVLAFFLQRRLMGETVTGESPRLPPRSEWWTPFLRMAAMGWAQALNQQIGTIILSGLSSDVEIAHFRIAQQLSLLVAFGSTVVTTLYAQDFSRLFVRGDLRGIEKLASKTALIGGATALAIGSVFLLGGPWLLARVYGSAFAPAYASLVILIAGQLINAILGPVTLVLVASRNETIAMIAHLLAVTANILLCVLLVPWWGAMGAALGSSAALALWNVMLFVVLRRRLGISMFVRRKRSVPDSKGR
jgi:O-antigen/teichoic acid export membrane protein